MLAAASLTEVFDELAARSRSCTRVSTITASFGGSSALAAQIVRGRARRRLRHGERGDDEDGRPTRGWSTNADRLRHEHARDRRAAGNPAGVDAARRPRQPRLEDRALRQDRARAGRRPSTLLGGRERRRVTPDTLEKDVKAVLTKVELGEVDAGLVYVTDALAAGDKVRRSTCPRPRRSSTGIRSRCCRRRRTRRRRRPSWRSCCPRRGRSALDAAGFGPRSMRRAGARSRSSRVVAGARARRCSCCRSSRSCCPRPWAAAARAARGSRVLQALGLSLAHRRDLDGALPGARHPARRRAGALGVAGRWSRGACCGRPSRSRSCCRRSSAGSPCCCCSGAAGCSASCLAAGRGHDPVHDRGRRHRADLRGDAVPGVRGRGGAARRRPPSRTRGRHARRVAAAGVPRRDAARSSRRGSPRARCCASPARSASSARPSPSPARSPA